MDGRWGQGWTRYLAFTAALLITAPGPVSFAQSASAPVAIPANDPSRAPPDMRQPTSDRSEGICRAARAYRIACPLAFQSFRKFSSPRSVSTCL